MRDKNPRATIFCYKHFRRAVAGPRAPRSAHSPGAGNRVGIRCARILFARRDTARSIGRDDCGGSDLRRRRMGRIRDTVCRFCRDLADDKDRLLAKTTTGSGGEPGWPQCRTGTRKRGRCRRICDNRHFLPRVRIRCGGRTGRSCGRYGVERSGRSTVRSGMADYQFPRRRSWDERRCESARDTRRNGSSTASSLCGGCRSCDAELWILARGGSRLSGDDCGQSARRDTGTKASSGQQFRQPAQYPFRRTHRLRDVLLNRLSPHHEAGAQCFTWSSASGSAPVRNNAASARR
jgi:hypothetical protein